MDEPYKNREIDEMMKEIRESLGRIESQTTRTNGRVTKCEDSLFKLFNWKNYIAGGLVILSTIGLPIMVYTIYNTVEMNKALAMHIQEK